jgi:PAS domain-containing protein
MHDVNPLDIVETIREGVLVVEFDLTIRFGNRSFCHTFAVAPKHTVGRKLYEIGNGQWDIPKLLTSLETIISGRKTIEAFEVENFFPSIGQRILAFNARKVYRPGTRYNRSSWRSKTSPSARGLSTSTRPRTSVSACCCKS